ncbi:MAG: IS30 family transposase [Lachnospiraceae bacterium]|nr:IS30 family transposase [Lachnospiraceae bacterium]
MDNEKKQKKKQYNYITERDRYIIEHLYNNKHYSIRKISIELNREYSTVYREIHKGLITQMRTDLTLYTTYKADYAHTTSKENLSRRGREMKCKRNSEFIKYLEHKIIKEKYSPYSALIMYENAPVCLNTVYNYINSKNITRIQITDLPYKRKKKPKHQSRSKVSKTNTLCNSIDDRPEDVNDRSAFGHWEMDSVVGSKNGGSAFLVFTERQTRLELIRKLKTKNMENVVREIDRLEKQLGRKDFRLVFKSITSDNGVEFLDNKGIEKDRTTLYYCHPYRSSERGSNENQNKLIRRFYPKGTSLNKVSPDDIINLQDFINTYPRALFAGKSSVDLLGEVSAADPTYERIITKMLTIC